MVLQKCSAGGRRPGRPRQFELEQRADIILAAAERIVVEKGLAAASMEAIAREAGMSKRTLYELFDSRSALFAAIVRRLRDAVTHPLSQEEAKLSLEARLRLLLTPRSSKFYDPLPTMLLRAMVTEAERQPSLAAEFLREGIYKVHAMIRTELDRAVAQGEIRISDTEAAARLMADMAYDGVLEHLLTPLPAHEQIEAFHRRLDLAIRVFLKGIGE
ncbi:TetR/AcrR family transcriptional regulator [Rhizobium sp. L1K21]|uniref:TetR/AcrR family transcriptional regulator n=1 Tax=Rhizobium sp. L1K21 TaxID=2954933 RepID=UPI0020938803|nr:TetR/AcrR family transcriptional regulator [Rhizobium sp. L1K21]MCO6187745.1 TetR/AcrR family transcriptional regulator [Rhizobium sp. L1K21]